MVSLDRRREDIQKDFLGAVDKYNKNHREMEIQPEGIETKLYREKLPSAIASNDTPDIYLCYTNAYLENAVNSGKSCGLTIIWAAGQ